MIYQTEFTNLANKFINEYSLCSSTGKYDILEIEFYYNSPGHPDPFVHCDDDQSAPNMWYFHKQNGKSYKEGTFRGLDITFSLNEKSKNKIYGGILIRSIYDIENKKMYEGSCLSINQIMGETSSVANFVSKLDSMDIKYSNEEIDYPLYFLKKDTPKKIICCSPRVGLTLKKDTENQINYIMKEYRFHTSDNFKKFRVGTFLALHRQNKIKVYTKKDASYIDDFNNADISQIDKSKSLSTSDLCKLYGYCAKNKLI